MRELLVSTWLLIAGADPSAERLRVLSEKLALDLQDSRRCEVSPENGNMRCNYEYRGLRFTRWMLTLPSGKTAHVSIESLEPGNVGVQLNAFGPCFLVMISSARPEDVAVAHMNIKDGRISANGRAIGCFPKARSK